MIYRPVYLCLLLAFFAAGCGASDSPSRLPTVSMRIGSKTFTLEIARSEAAKEHGLMERDSMPADHGMIFVFETPTDNPFWMYHTRFPLEVIFIDPDSKVIAIKSMKPYDKTPVGSPSPYQWAIELHPGAAEDAGLKPGMAVKIPPQAAVGAP